MVLLVIGDTLLMSMANSHKSFVSFFSKKEILALLVSISITVLLLALCFRLFSLLPSTSDQAAGLLVAQDICAGNWRLGGWWLPPDNYLGLDEVITGALWVITGNPTLTLRLTPVITWVILSLVMLWLGMERRRNQASAILVLAATILLPTRGMDAANFFFRLNNHVLTTAAILAVIGLAQVAHEADKPHRWIKLTLGLLTLDAAASDPMFIYTGALPLLAALTLSSGAIGRRGRLFALILAAILAGRLLVMVNGVSGGFATLPTNLGLVSPAGLPLAMARCVEAVLSICRGTSSPLGQAAMYLGALRLPLFVLAGATVIRTASRSFEQKENTGVDLRDIALCFVVFANIAAVILSNSVFDLNGADRYLLPGWAAATVLVARRLELKMVGKTYCFVIVILALCTDVGVIRRAPAPTVVVPEPSLLADSLLAHDLHDGYGTYWLASAGTVASNGVVRIRAVYAVADRISAYHFNSKSQWYRGLPTSARFFVAAPRGDIWLPQSAVLATFGTPSLTFISGSTVVYVYSGPMPPVN